MLLTVRHRYAYTHLAHEGGWEMEKYPTVRMWFARLEAMDGFIKFNEL